MKKKRLILMGVIVSLLGVLWLNITIPEMSEENDLFFSNTDALAQTETSKPADQCIYSGYMCVGLKDGCMGKYPGLATVKSEQ